LLSREKYYYFWGGNEGTELLDSSLIDYIYYTYNDAGLRISMKTQISQTEYSYNSRGLVAETRYSLLNSGTMIIQCKYNSSGLLIEKRVKEFDGTMSITEFMDHDQFGNWTRRMSYREDSNSRFLQRRRIQYFY
jgi:hypothetical protein